MYIIPPYDEKFGFYKPYLNKLKKCFKKYPIEIILNYTIKMTWHIIPEPLATLFKIFTLLELFPEALKKLKLQQFSKVGAEI